MDTDPARCETATFDDATDTFTIPPRRTVVVVSPQALPTAGTLDFVGLMWPRGGVANLIDQGRFGTCRRPWGLGCVRTGLRAGRDRHSGAGRGHRVHRALGPVSRAVGQRADGL